MQMVGMIEKNGNNERKWEERVTSWRDGVITELQSLMNYKAFHQFFWVILTQQG